MMNDAETFAAQPQTLRRAIAFIHDNAHLDIRLTDIATAIGVTPARFSTSFAAILVLRRSSTCDRCAFSGRTAIFWPLTPLLTP